LGITLNGNIWILKTKIIIVNGEMLSRVSNAPVRMRVALVELGINKMGQYYVGQDGMPVGDSSNRSQYENAAWFLMP